MTEMEVIELNLYKVYGDRWNDPAYVAANNQQDAVDKVSPSYPDEKSECLTVEYVNSVLV